MDMGTGCGIVPILLAYRHPSVRFLGIELQETLALLAVQNVEANGMKDRIDIRNQDLRTLSPKEIIEPVDWIVCNPPYRPANSGRMNPNQERAVARHEIELRLNELVSACRRFLKTGGHFATIYPADRMVDLLAEMRSAGIEPKWMQGIHARQDEPAKLVLVKGAMRGRPGLKMAPPLVMYEPDGQYTSALERMMAP